jgi:hypothetical protein
MEESGCAREENLGPRTLDMCLMEAGNESVQVGTGNDTPGFGDGTILAVAWSTGIVVGSLASPREEYRSTNKIPRSIEDWRGIVGQVRSGRAGVG